jgi:tol-pal system protein YbgF
MSFKNISYLFAILLLLSIGTVFAQDIDQLKNQLEQIQKDIKTLEKAVYSKNSPTSTSENNFSEALTLQLNKISELQKQIDQLTSRFEENNYKIEQLNNQLNKFKEDSQLRLQQLESYKSTNEISEKKSLIIEKDLSKEPSQDYDVTKEKDKLLENIKVVTEDENKKDLPIIKILPKKSPSEQYKFSMNLLKNGKFEDAEHAFREFVYQHPDHELSGNAQFWYGETFYIRQLYEDAARAYLAGYQKYPKSTKAPENLLKLGVSLAELGEVQQGCKMMLSLKEAYPKTDASVLQKASYEKKRFNCS